MSFGEIKNSVFEEGIRDIIFQINRRVRDSILLGTQNIQQNQIKTEISFSNPSKISNNDILNFMLKNYKLELTKKRKIHLKEEVDRIDKIIIERKLYQKENSIVLKKIRLLPTELRGKSLKMVDDILWEKKELEAKDFIIKIKKGKIRKLYKKLELSNSIKLPQIMPNRYFSLNKSRNEQFYERDIYEKRYIEELPPIIKDKSRNSSYIVYNTEKKPSVNKIDVLRSSRLEKIKRKYKIEETGFKDFPLTTEYDQIL